MRKRKIGLAIGICMLSGLMAGGCGKGQPQTESSSLMEGGVCEEKEENTEINKAKEVQADVKAVSDPDEDDDLKSGNKTEIKTDSQTGDDAKTYATKQELMEIGGLTEEEIQDLDLDQFVRKYDLTAETIPLYDLHQLAQNARLQAQKEKNTDYGYVCYAVDEDQSMQSSDLRDLRVLALVEKTDGYERSRIVDLQNAVIYDGDAMNLLDGAIDAYTPAKVLTTEKEETLNDTLQGISWQEWQSYKGQSDQAAEGSGDGWDLYLYMKNGTSIYYSGETGKKPAELEEIFSL